MCIFKIYKKLDKKTHGIFVPQVDQLLSTTRLTIATLPLQHKESKETIKSLMLPSIGGRV